MSLPFGSFAATSAREAPTRWAALILILLSLGPATLAQKSEEHDKDDPRARAEYLEQKRGGKAGTPPGARLRALKEVDGMLEREGKAYWDSVSKASTSPTVESSGAVRETSTIVPSASQWTPIGPQPSHTNLSAGNYPLASGRVTALAVDPRDVTGNTVYLGAAQGGVWKTTDGGTTWIAISDNEQSLAIGSIAIDGTTNPSTIYVGTGEENFGSDSYYGIGILKSTDCTAFTCTWTPIPATNFTTTIPECSSSRLGCGGPRIGAIAIQPGTGGASAVLLTAVQNGFSNTGGIYRSANAGITWTPVLSGVTADTVVWGNSQIAYAGVDGAGVYVSFGNGGNSFSAANGGVITTTGTGRVVLAIDPGNATIAYASVEAATSTTSTISGFYKGVANLSNGAVTWTKLGPGTLPTIPDYCGGGNSDQCFYDNVIAVNPQNSNVVFAGGSGNPNNSFLVRSTDGGSNWSLATNAIHADQHAMAFTSNGKLYIGNDGGVYSTTDTTPGSPAPTWANLNNSLNTMQFYGYFAIHPTNSQLTYGGTQDNGTQKFTGQSLNNTLPWDEVTCGDGAGAVFDINNPTTVYANCQQIDVRKTTTGNPFDFTHVDSGLGGNDPVAFIPPLVGDSANPMGLYFGTDHLWKSTTGGSSWSKVWPTALTAGGTISNIAISADNNTAYTVSDDGKVFKVSTLATSPVASDVTGTGLPTGVSINAVAISPSNSNVAYLAVAGFNAGQHVFKTTSGGGGTWISIDGGAGSALPNSPANDIVIDPDLVNTLYVATDVGVFKSTDDGASWTTLSTGLPKVAVYGLKLHRPSRTLRAATHGRGMWDLAVPACSVGPCLTLSLSSLNFGNQNVGTSSAPQTITLTSSGTQALTIGGISSSNPTEFSITGNTCGATLAASTTCTMSVTFTPSNAFSRSGTLSISSDAPSSPTTSALSGVGIVVPPNDNFANGKIISALPYGDSVITNGATSETTDPVPPRGSTSCVDVDYDPTSGFNHHSVWYFYTPAASDIVTIDTSGSSYDTVVSVWTGSQGNFPASPLACNDDIDPGVVRQSRLTFGVTAGTTYRILVTGYYGTDSGTLMFSMNSLNLGFSRLARNGAAGTGQSISPGSRPARPVRSAADIVVVAGQSRSLDLELTSSGNSNEVINLECVGAPPGASCTVEPVQVTLNGASIPIQVRFDTSKAVLGSGRAKRLSVTPVIAAGSYELQVSARAGDVVKSTFFAIQVISNQPSKQRLSVQQSQK